MSAEWKNCWHFWRTRIEFHFEDGKHRWCCAKCMAQFWLSLPEAHKGDTDEQ